MGAAGESCDDKQAQARCGGLWGPGSTSNSPALFLTSFCSEMTAHTSALVTRRLRPRPDGSGSRVWGAVYTAGCAWLPTALGTRRWSSSAAPRSQADHPPGDRSAVSAGGAGPWIGTEHAAPGLCPHSGLAVGEAARRTPDTGRSGRGAPVPPVPPTTVCIQRSTPKGGHQEGPSSSDRRPCWWLRPLPQSTFWF